MTEKSEWGKTPPISDEHEFLRGPQSRGVELARLLRITTECIRGFRQLHFVGPCVTVFGSARFEEDNPYYDLARRTGHHLAKAGFTVMTGGGPGIMEAANRGAKEAGGTTVGCNIQLPREQKPNPYLDLWLEFRYFFVRKLMLTKYSYAFIAMPGGFGTLDEMMEIATLIQTGKLKNFPVIFVGTDYWSPFIDFLRGTMVKSGTIHEEDVSRFILTDSPEDAAMVALRQGMKEFHLTKGAKFKRPPAKA